MTTGLKWIFIAIAMCGFTITQANAANMYGPYQVKSLFAESANTAGFFVVEGLPQCLYGLMYIDLSSAAGKGQFALETIDVSELMRETSGLIESIVGSNAQLEMQLDDSLPAGAEVRKYGVVIGRLDAGVEAGDHVHVHNLQSKRGR